VEGFALEATVVMVAAISTTCDNAELALPE
jgi:hypothetical protein